MYFCGNIHASLYFVKTSDEKKKIMPELDRSCLRNKHFSFHIGSIDVIIFMPLCNKLVYLHTFANKMQNKKTAGHPFHP